jgi:hypothetical protein
MQAQVAGARCDLNSTQLSRTPPCYAGRSLQQRGGKQVVAMPARQGAPMRMTAMTPPAARPAVAPGTPAAPGAPVVAPVAPAVVPPAAPVPVGRRRLV